MRYTDRKVFNITDKNQPAEGCTVSEKLMDDVTVFSLAAHTDISAERYTEDTLVVVYSGHVIVKEKEMHAFDAMVIPAGTDFGLQAQEDTVLIEASVHQGNVTEELMHLNDLAPYQGERIVNRDVVHGQNMKYAVLAFDKHTGLDEHSAPGNALVTALDGKGIIGYEGKEYPIQAGESFMFKKNGRHYVKAEDDKFRMSLLLNIR